MGIVWLEERDLAPKKKKKREHMQIPTQSRLLFPRFFEVCKTLSRRKGAIQAFKLVVGGVDGAAEKGKATEERKPSQIFFCTRRTP